MPSCIVPLAPLTRAPSGARVAFRSGPRAGVTGAGITGMVTGAAFDGVACPAVVTLAVGDADVAPAGIDTPIRTGGRLAPGCAVAAVVQVTCWPSMVHVQPGPVALVTACPVGTSNVSVDVP